MRHGCRLNIVKWGLMGEMVVLISIPSIPPVKSCSITPYSVGSTENSHPFSGFRSTGDQTGFRSTGDKVMLQTRYQLFFWLL